MEFSPPVKSSGGVEVLSQETAAGANQPLFMKGDSITQKKVYDATNDLYITYDEKPTTVKGGVKFSNILPAVKQIDLTILLLANPRAGSQLASVFVTDYPKETTKLVV